MSFTSSHFDPHAARRTVGGRLRGSRFRLLMTIGTVFLIGAVTFEWWLWNLGGGPKAQAAPVVRPTRAKVPDFVLPAAQAEASPPPREARAGDAGPQRAPSEPRRTPTQIAFNVRASQPDLAWFHDGRRPQLAKGCALRPGATIIRAALLTTIRSEVTGQAIAQVTEDVYDVDGVGRLLIPAGTRVVGVYKASGGLDFQRRRLDFVWTAMTMPDGEEIDLGNANGMDAAGSMGIGGEVRTHWGELIATAALLTVFDGIQRSAVPNDNSLADSMQRAASENTGELGKEVTRRVLQWEPDILIPGGTEITIAPQKTFEVC